MRVNTRLTNRLILLAVLVLLAVPAQPGRVAASEIAAQPQPPPAELLPSTDALAAPPSEAAAVSAAATPGVNYLSYHSFLFQPIRPETDWEYSFAQGTLHLLSTIQGGQFVLPLSLPHGVDIRELTYFFRDNDAGIDLSMGLCRVANGDDATGCLLWKVNSTGVNQSGVVERTLTGDPILTIDNENFSYFLVVVINTTGPSFGIVSARVGYATSTFLPSVQR